MYWTVLLISAVLEAVWATALGASEGLSRPGPTVLFFIALSLSMVGLGYAMRGIPIGTAYAVWTGAGAVLTVAYAVVFTGEAAGLLKILFLLGIIGCVIGLKVVDSKQPKSQAAAGRSPD